MGKKYWQKVYLERVVGKYLANLHLNKTIRLYNCSKSPKNSVFEDSARRGTSPSFYTYEIECVVVSISEFTVNEVTTSSYKALDPYVSYHQIHRW